MRQLRKANGYISPAPVIDLAHQGYGYEDAAVMLGITPTAWWRRAYGYFSNNSRPSYEYSFHFLRRQCIEDEMEDELDWMHRLIAREVPHELIAMITRMPIESVRYIDRENHESETSPQREDHVADSASHTPKQENAQ